MSAEKDADAIQQMVDQILSPEVQKVEFAGYTVSMKPASIAVMKRLRKLTAELQKSSRAYTDLEDEERKDPSRMADLDSSVADLLVTAAKELLESYGVAVTREFLETTVSLSAVEMFIQKQLSLNRSEDFLSRPLKNIIEVYSPNLKEERVYPNS